MMTSHVRGAALAFHVFLSICANAQILWKEPGPSTVSDWTWGPGGEELAPRPPFQFVKERLGGTNPKMEVQDQAGRHWTVKFGSEVHADTFAARLVNALGYAAEPTFFIKSGSIERIHDLKRAKHFVSRNGFFESARFKLRGHRAKDEAEHSAWLWTQNPFVGSHELNGLKILVMLASNWDTKDARDGEDGSNNGIIRRSSTGNSAGWYAVTDWGASFGVSGGFFKRARWDWNGYRSQTSRFVRVAPDGTLNWGFKGKHRQDITTGVSIEDVRWLVPYLARISDENLIIGLSASGASQPVAESFARSIRERIIQLQRIAEPEKVKQAAK